MTIATHALPVPYTDNNQLPKVLEAFERYVAKVYDDLAPAGPNGPGHYATIGIGLNIRGNQDALRLMLDYLGVFQADNATQEALRFQAGLPQRTQAQILARHKTIVADFSALIASYQLSGVAGSPGTSLSEGALQTALSARLAFYGAPGLFEFPSSTDARLVKIRLIQGYAVGKTLETTEAELIQTVFPHPTLSEMMHESVLAAYGRAVHI